MGRLGEKPLLILGTLLINQMFHCHAQDIAKIALAVFFNFLLFSASLVSPYKKNSSVGYKLDSS